jgi:diguanylate cyclase (GGDEF)-like protein
MFDALFDALPVAVTVWEPAADLDDLGAHTLVAANAAAEALFGADVRSRAGAPLDAVLPASVEGGAELPELIVAAHTYRTARVKEIEIDGRIVLVHGAPLGDRHVITVCVDHTAWLASRQQLALINQLLDNAPDMVIIGRYGSGALDYVNATSSALLGLEEGAGEPEIRFEDRLTDDSYEVYLNDALPTASRAGIWEGELEFEPFPGRLLPTSAVVLCTEEDPSAPDRFAVLARDITGQRHDAEKLRSAAMHDALTGLPNRMQLEDRLNQAVEEFHGAGVPSILLYLDLDRFKPINDEHGHEAGDVVLREVGARLRSSLRGNDLAARLGGDEFVVLATGLTEATARNVSARVEHSIGEPIALPSGAIVSVGVSIGMVPLDPTISGAAEWLAAADFAMYEIKRDHHR